MLQTRLRVWKQWAVWLLLMLTLQHYGIEAQPQCTPVAGELNFCQCQMSDGTGVVDLSPFANGDQTYHFTANDPKGYEYYYNPCFVMNYGDGACNMNTAAICQVDPFTPGEISYHVTGAFSDVTFNVNANGLLEIHYGGGGDGRVSDVTLICDHGVTGEPQFAALGEPNTGKDYEFILTSACACPSKSGACDRSGGSKKGGTDAGIVGIVLLVLLIAGVASYFIIGAVVLRVRYEKSGTDLIINKGFWMDFPFLIKDGFIFTFSPCYKLVQEKRGYSTVK